MTQAKVGTIREERSEKIFFLENQLHNYLWHKHWSAFAKKTKEQANVLDWSTHVSV